MEAQVRVKGQATGSLKRGSISSLGAIAQSLGVMGPVVGVAFMTPLLAGSAGVSVPLSTLLAGIGVLSLGYVIATFASRFVSAGSLYDYITRAAGVKAGFLAGWVYYFGLTLFTLAMALAVGGWTADMLSGFGINIHWLVYDLIYAVLIFTMNYLGVELTVRTQLILAAVASTVVLLFALYLIAVGGVAGNTFAPFTAVGSSTGFTGIAFAMIFGVMLFTGFETSANLAEEAHAPRRTIPTAVMGTVIFGLLYFLIVGYAEAIGFGVNGGEAWAKSETPLYALGQQFGNALVVALLTAAGVVDAMAVGLGCLTATSRGLFAMGRSGVLPSSLARTHKQHQTPYVSISFLVGLILVMEVAIALTGTPWYVVFSTMAAGGSLCMLIVYFTLCVSSIAYFKRNIGRDYSALRHVVVPVIGALATAAAFYASVWPIPDFPTSLAPIGAIVWLALGAGLLLFTHKNVAFRSFEEIAD